MGKRRLGIYVEEREELIHGRRRVDEPITSLQKLLLELRIRSRHFFARFVTLDPSKSHTPPLRFHTIETLRTHESKKHRESARERTKKIWGIFKERNFRVPSSSFFRDFWTNFAKK
jgi:hypothetical protein